MSKQLIWRPMPLAPSHGIPVLLVAVSIGAAAYTVRVTDMANIWVEDLDRKAICMRGWDENTSIDPSDTPENMAKLLSSLRSALDLSQPGHDQTSLTLSPGSTSDAGEDGLIVRVTCPLPGLQPLKWPLHLKKSPPSALATDLVLPLIEEHYTRKLQLESLIQSLNQKDAIIAKLADKLEATGTGLENVFTGLSSKKKVTRAMAGEKIKGLAPFSTSQLRENLDQREARPTSAAELIQCIFEGDGMQSKPLMEIDASPGLDGWWRDFKKGTTHPMHRNSSTVVPVNKTPSPAVAGSANDGDDNFEVQATPPHLRTKKIEAAAPDLDDGSTASEDEDDDATTRKHMPIASKEKGEYLPMKQTAPRTGFMGTIGGKKQAPATSTQSEESRGSGPGHYKSPVAEEDIETASEAETASVQDEAEAEAAPAPPSPPSLAKAPIRKGGLGRIGGTAAKAQPEESSTLGSPTSSSPRRKPGMIGKIGGVTISKPAAGADGVERGRASAHEDKETPIIEEENKVRETSQERANRRREELKKDLEKKAAAGPAKKKRRF